MSAASLDIQANDRTLHLTLPSCYAVLPRHDTVSSMCLGSMCDVIYGMLPMAKSTKTMMLHALSLAKGHLQQRYTL